MSLPYLARLACLCFAAFFVIHSVLAVAVSLLSPRAVSGVAELKPKAAAQLLFAMRLLPATVAWLCVLGLCAPSYLVFEPRATNEQLGPACLLAAFLGGMIFASGLLRGALAVMRSAQFLRECGKSDLPLFVLAGVFRPRLIVAPALREALTADEFEAALLHEEAHHRAKDNLRRLLILLTPDIFPTFHGFRRLDSGWRRLAEWAADDYAVGDSPDRALALASALVRVGRFRGAAVSPLPLGTSLLADGNDLRLRVERLTENRSDYQSISRVVTVGAASAAVVVIGVAPVMLPAVHRVMEVLAQ